MPVLISDFLTFVGIYLRGDTSISLSGEFHSFSDSIDTLQLVFLREETVPVALTRSRGGISELAVLLREV